MARAVANIDAVTAILKDQYGPLIEKQVYDSTLVLNKVAKVKSTMGKKTIGAIDTTRWMGIGSPHSGERLPDALTSTYATPVAYLGMQAAQITIEDSVMQQAATNTQSFANVKGRDMENMAEIFGWNEDRQLCSDGSGFLLNCTAGCGTVGASSSSTLVVQPYGVNHLEQYIIPGMELQFMDSGDLDTPYVAGGKGVTVTGITQGTATQATLGFATGSGITVGASSAGIYIGLALGVMDKSISTLATASGIQMPMREVMGIAGCVSDSDPIGCSVTGLTGLQNLPVATNPLWKAKVWSNSGTLRALTPTMLLIAIQHLKTRTSADEAAKNLALLSNMQQIAAYGAIPLATGGTTGNALGQRRFGADDRTYDEGFAYYAYAGTKWYEHARVWNNRVFGVKWSNFEIHQLGPPAWVDEDGAVLHRGDSANGISFEAWYRHYCTLWCRRRNDMFVISDLDESFY